MASTCRELVMIGLQHFAKPSTTDTAGDNLAPRTTSPDYHYHLNIVDDFTFEATFLTRYLVCKLIHLGPSEPDEDFLTAARLKAKEMASSLCKKSTHAIKKFFV